MIANEPEAVDTLEMSDPEQDSDKTQLTDPENPLKTQEFLVVPDDMVVEDLREMA